jgi:hypothetical protein
MVADGEFRCAACDGVFDRGWSDDDAAAELGQTFPGFEIDDCDMVCDDTDTARYEEGYADAFHVAGMMARMRAESLSAT